MILLLTGGGVLIYLLMWIAIPAEYYEPETEDMENQKHEKSGRSDSGNMVAGVLLITIGALFLIARYFPEIDFRDIWPWSLIVIGLLLLFKGLRRNN